MKETKRTPIRRKILRVLIAVSSVTLLLSGVLGVYSLMRLRDASEAALADQLEKNLYNTIADKAALADVAFDNFADRVAGFADYIGDFYAHPELHVGRDVLPPNTADAGRLTMQRYLVDDNVRLEDIQEELMLFGGLQLPWNIATAQESSIITTIYVGTESGFMVSYDNRAELGVEPGSYESHYDYRGSDWYQAAIQKGSVGFTDIYADSYGRGMMVTCYAPFYDAAGKFRGVVCADLLIDDLYQEIVSMDLGANGRVFLVDGAGCTVADDGSLVPFEGLIGDKNVAASVLSGTTGFALGSDGNYYSHAHVESTGWNLCIMLPEATVFEPVYAMSRGIERLIIVLMVFFALTLVCVVLVAIRFSKALTDPLVALGKDALTISGGNLDYRAKVTGNDEISDLAQSFNQMAASLKQYIADLTAVTKEKERIGAELNVATQIQADMLPRIFPPFPERSEFDIYATMDPAKEVGGDFYDFFLVDQDHLALVMADVSGKGVPAALFMVIAKTLIKTRTQMGGTPAEILADVNNQLCEGNEAGLFVTVWLAIVEISTGKGVASNAGHEHPAIRHKDGSFELVKYRHSPAVATMQGIRFREHEFQLLPGDFLFVYTDGVPEATNGENVLFGEERTVEALNRNPHASPKIILQSVKASIDEFVGDAVQFDDITMLGLDYYGKEGKSNG